MTAKVTALVVDDERLPRRELRAMLGEFPCVSVVGEAADATEALALIHTLEPDAVFLDIQMPGMSGFDMLDRIDRPIKVVFTTAFDAYAIRAFEVNALDYLLKPINRTRLARAVERLAADAVAEPPARTLQYDDRIFLAADGKPRLLKVEAIACISGAGDYSEVHTADGRTTLVPKPLKEWEERLPERYFARIHRSAIVNLEFVDRIEEAVNGGYLVYVRGISEPFAMSRQGATRLKERF